MSESLHTGSSIVLATEQDTVRFGEFLASVLPERWVLGLTGELGAGKTTVVKGLAQGLAITDAISSPTFALIHQYDGKLPFIHCDWYRIERNSELDAIGWDELVDTHPRIVIEWSDKFPNRLPKETRHLHFTFQDECRRVTLGDGW